MFVNIFFAYLRFLLLASRFVKRKSPCLLNVRYFLLLVFISITTFPLSCIYYITLYSTCQQLFTYFFNFFLSSQTFFLFVPLKSFIKASANQIPVATFIEKFKPKHIEINLSNPQHIPQLIPRVAIVVTKIIIAFIVFFILFTSLSFDILSIAFIDYFVKHFFKNFLRQ